MEIDYNYFKEFENSNLYLCSPNKEFICVIDSVDKKCTLRLTGVSELTMNVYEIIQDNKGNEIKQQCYDLLESKRVIFVERIGWFEIKNVVENCVTKNKYKSLTLQSEQCKINNTGICTENRIYKFYDEKDKEDNSYNPSNIESIPSIIGQLNKQLGIKLDIKDNDEEIKKDYKEWTICYVDDELKDVYRTMEKTTVNGYDFMISNVADAFENVWEFDIVHHAIKAKTIKSIVTPTEIYLSGNNLVNELQITENSDDIVTVLNCNGSNLDISEVNLMGTNYIVNFDYYLNENNKWITKNLRMKIDEWKRKCNEERESFDNHIKELYELYEYKTKQDLLLENNKILLEDLNNARDLYITNTPLLLEEFIYISNNFDELEKIKDKKSKDENSEFYKEKEYFNIDEKTYTCYKNPFKLKGSNTTKDYINTSLCKEDTLENNINNGYIYFQDDDKTTYCKISKIKDIKENNNTENNNDKTENDSEEKNSEREKTEKKDVKEYYIKRYGVFCEDNNFSWCTEVKTDSEAIITVEIIDETNNTIDNESVFINENTFKEYGEELKFYNEKPKYDNKNKKFYYDNENNNYIAKKINEYNEEEYAYFLDGDKNTYCKCKFSIEIDEDNNLKTYVSAITRFAIISNFLKWISLQETKKSDIENNIKTKENEIKEKLELIENITNKCNIIKYFQEQDESLYNELKAYWIEGSYDNNNLAVTDTTKREEYIKLAKELMKQGEEQLKRISQPKYSINVSAVNFLRIPEFIKFAEQLQLGRTITIEKEDGQLLVAALTELSFNLDDGDDFSLTFSNSTKLNSNDFTFNELVKQTSTVARNVQSNWGNINSYIKDKDKINSIIQDPLNRSLRNAQNITNQEFIVDNTGIIGRKYIDSSKSSFDEEQIRMINNTILFTDDNWKNTKTALGKIYYDNKTAYGLVAETIIGSLIMSDKLKVGSEDNLITLDKKGIIINSKILNEDTKEYENGITFEANTKDGVSIKNKDGNAIFNADTKGNLTITGEVNATSGTFTGEVNATSGNIGGFEIKENSITYVAENNENDRMVLSAKGISDVNYKVDDSEENTLWKFIVGEKFGITNNGTVFIKEGNFSGAINSKIINTDNLYVDNILPKTTDDNNKSTTKISNFDIGEFNQVITNNIIGEGKEENNELVELTFKYKLERNNEHSLKLTTYNIDNEEKPLIEMGYPKYSKQIPIIIYYKLSSSKTPYAELVYIRDESQNIFNLDRKIVSFGINSTDLKDNESIVEKTVVYNQLSNLVINVTSSLIPKNNNIFTLGDNSHRWGDIYGVNGEIITSDKNEKYDIKPIIDKYSNLFDKLQPVTYKLKNGESGRTHIGLIAQDVEQAIIESDLTTKETAFFIKNNKDGNGDVYGLRYGELISLNMLEIQKLKTRIKELEKMINNK